MKYEFDAEIKKLEGKIQCSTSVCGGKFPILR